MGIVSPYYYPTIPLFFVVVLGLDQSLFFFLWQSISKHLTQKGKQKNQTK